MPTVASRADVERHADQLRVVAVEGLYEHLDVRMRPADTLFAGHAGIVLDDGVRVFLYPPQDDAAIRSPEEIARFEHRPVRALGLLLSRNPRPGAAQVAPCLIDVRSIEPLSSS